MGSNSSCCKEFCSKAEETFNSGTVFTQIPYALTPLGDSMSLNGIISEINSIGEERIAETEVTERRSVEGESETESQPLG